MSTVPTTTDTTPAVKRADQLKPGEWLREHDDHFAGPALVLSAHAYTDAFGNPRVLLVVETQHDVGPQTVRLHAGAVLELAMDEEVEQARAEFDRDRIARELAELGELIAENKLPLPPYSLRLAYELPDRDAVEALGKALGKALGIEPTFSASVKKLSVVWPQGRKSYEQGVYADFYCYLAETPAEPAGEA